jgi:alpha-1,6-mannosyltransferase
VEGSPLVHDAAGLASGRTACGFLALLAAAFAAYLAGLVALRRRELPFRPVAVLAVAIQLVPLGAPLLLSTDAWTYWAYGWIGIHGGNPYVDEPSAYPQSPAYPHMGAAWRDTTSVYGPAFGLATEPLAAVTGDSTNVAAWLYKALGAVAMASAALLVARVASRRALAVAFVGWNPLLAIHAAGGGHNDAWVAAALAAALALAAARRPAGAGVAWALAVLLKWVPLFFLALRALEARSRGRRVSHLGFALGAAGVLAAATWRFGWSWMTAVVPLANNAALETSYAIPARLQQFGLPEAVALAVAALGFLAGAALLALDARRGHSRLGRAACLVLLTTPYLIVWYLAWAATLAAADEDRVARAGVLALSVYLLPQTIPL